MEQGRESNTRLREAITLANWTYEAVALAVRRVAAENGETLQTNKSAVAHWVAGTRPSGRGTRYLAEAFARRLGRPVTLAELGLAASEEPETINSDPVLAATALGRADVEHRPFLAAAAFSVSEVAMPLGYDHAPVARLLAARTGSHLIGQADIDVVRQITAAFSIADERLGGGHGLSTVTAYLADTAAPMLRSRFAGDHQRRQAFAAVAELAYLAGWKHHDLGQEGAAQRYYQVGFQLACEADPQAHAAWMMRALAQQALSLRQPSHCVDLIEAALTCGRGHLDPGTQALLHITQARAYAATGRKTSAARALLAAEDAARHDSGIQPSYSQVSGPIAGTLASHTARTLTELGDHCGTERQHRAALKRWDPTHFKRVHALTYADLGDSLAAQARADEAITVWNKALDLADDLTSSRTCAAVRTIRTHLVAYRKRAVPGATELDQRARDALN